MDGLPDPQWYFDNVLIHTGPDGGGRVQIGPAALWQQWWSVQAAATDDEAVVLARSQGFVAAVEQLRALGWQRHDDRRELFRGRWCTVGHGCRSPVDAAGGDELVALRRLHALSASAAVLVRPSHRVSGRSAAILHGLPTLGVPTRPELTAGNATLVGGPGRMFTARPSVWTRRSGGSAHRSPRLRARWSTSPDTTRATPSWPRTPPCASSW